MASGDPAPRPTPAAPDCSPKSAVPMFFVPVLSDLLALAIFSIQVVHMMLYFVINLLGTSHQLTRDLLVPAPAFGLTMWNPHSNALGQTSFCLFLPASILISLFLK